MLCAVVLLLSHNLAYLISDTFVQTLTLDNNYPPSWDYFPDDVNIGVFDDYGTEALGFPTAYQQCGASPVEVTYTDSIEDGSCFAEKILTRTFQAIDICGHVTTRAQIITIANRADDLPLGEKSLASVYGRERARIGNKNRICLWDLDCNIQDVPTNYECGTAPEDEFSDYSEFLYNLYGKSLNLGPTKKFCECETDDASCDAQKQAENDGTYKISVLYGTQVATAAGSCTVDTQMRGGSNIGFSSEVGSMQMHLVGTDDVYNFFSIKAEDVAEKSITVKAPSTSIALVNVETVELGQNITIGASNDGISLEGLPANNVLWNIRDGMNVKLTRTSRPSYAWHGSILNPLGLMQLTLSKKAENEWNGQLFCDNLNSNAINFMCAQFSGFASCDQVGESAVEPSFPWKEDCLTRGETPPGGDCSRCCSGKCNRKKKCGRVS